MNFWKKLKNKNKPILALAPLAGITDSAQRQLCKYFGADVLYTEMISSDGLFYDSKTTLDMLRISKKERPVVLQLFGKDPEKYKKAAKIVEAYGFDGIDINFGCPAKKVVAHSGGVSLMRDLDKCREIIKSVLDNTSLPVSVKIRTGINIKDNSKNSENMVNFDLDKNKKNVITAIDFVEKIKDLPISAIMIHGRTYEQKFSGEIDNKMIKDVIATYNKCKDKDRPIILANGGIMTPEDAKKVLDNTGADGLGIARGIYGKPFIFTQIKQYLNTGKYTESNFKLIEKAILKHAEFLFKDKTNKAHLEFRKYLLWYLKGINNISSLRPEIVSIKDIKDIKSVIKKAKVLSK